MGFLFTKTLIYLEKRVAHGRTPKELPARSNCKGMEIPSSSETSGSSKNNKGSFFLGLQALPNSKNTICLLLRKTMFSVYMLLHYKNPNEFVI